MPNSDRYACIYTIQSTYLRVRAYVSGTARVPAVCDLSLQLDGFLIMTSSLCGFCAWLRAADVICLSVRAHHQLELRFYFSQPMTTYICIVEYLMRGCGVINV